MNDKQNKSRKPLIAISARSQIQKGLPWATIPTPYFNAITQAGGIPAMVYGKNESLEEIANVFDALLIAGGSDIHPKFYNQHLLFAEPQDIEIDEQDRMLIHAFSNKHKPILGICRGLQCINTAFGGTLIQDITHSFPSIEAHRHDQQKRLPKMSFYDTYAHPILCEPHTKLFAMLSSSTYVNSFHHQCIDDVAEGFMISARSKDDQIIEGIERDNIIGVQWHPELLISNEQNRLLFQWLIKEAAVL